MSQPSGPIQAFMPGFLSLLSLKNKGLLPDTLIGNLQPVIDLEQYFLRGQVVGYSSSQALGPYLAATTTINPTFPSLVPNNEWWWVEMFGCQVGPLTAGDTLFMTPGWAQGSPPGTSLVKVGPEAGGAGVGAGAIVWAQSSNGFWLPPGAQLLLQLSATTTAAIETFTFSARIAKFLS